MTKKRSSEISGFKMEFFPIKGHSESWSVKFLFRPPKLGAKSLPMHGPKLRDIFYLLNTSLCIYNLFNYCSLYKSTIMMDFLHSLQEVAHL